LGAKVRVSAPSRPDAGDPVPSPGDHRAEYVVPLVVCHRRGVDPGLLMGLEGDVRPRMVGVGGEVESLRVGLEESGESCLEVHGSYRNRIDSTIPWGNSGLSALGTRNVDMLRRSPKTRLLSADFSNGPGGPGYDGDHGKPSEHAGNARW
jgi:hypothetical protein